MIDDPIEQIDNRDPIARLERIVAERHDSLVERMSASLARTERVVGALHEDLTGLDDRLDRLIGVLEAPLAEIAALRGEISALRDRVSALEQRPACALMTTREG